MVDGGWPRIYALPSGGSVLVYQPQVSSWDRQLHLVAFSALSYSAKATEKPTPGSIKLEVDTKVSHEERLVSLQNMKIVELNIPTVPKDRMQEIAAEIDKAIPDDERVIALDRVLANIDKSQIVPRNVEGVKSDPPAIFFSKTPAVIVNLDGEPIWSPIMSNDLKYAVNTNWDLFQHGTTNKLYLRNNDTWLMASDLQRRHGRQPASCRKASRSCRRKTTGRTSRPTCPARISRRPRYPRCSSASSRRN